MYVCICIIYAVFNVLLNLFKDVIVVEFIYLFARSNHGLSSPKERLFALKAFKIVYQKWL